MLDMTYDFPRKNRREDIVSQYMEIRDGLIRKYGEPIGNPDGTHELWVTQAISQLELCMIMYLCDDYIYDEWIVDCDDYHVKIESVAFDGSTPSSPNDYYHIVGYAYYTDEHYQKILDMKRQRTQDIDDDL